MGGILIKKVSNLKIYFTMVCFGGHGILGLGRERRGGAQGVLPEKRVNHLARSVKKKWGHFPIPYPPGKF